jgi:hypothetical protein
MIESAVGNVPHKIAIDAFDSSLRCNRISPGN